MEKNAYDIAIVGGGASGLMAACTILNRNAAPDIRVAIVEKDIRLGQKILSTGNGRCNLSNTDMDISHFHGHTLQTVESVLSRYGVSRTLDFFAKLGLMTETESGRIYPYTGQANAVLDVLRLAIEHSPFSVVCGTPVGQISRNKQTGNFSIHNSGTALYSRKLIVTAGGCVSHGSSSGGLDLLRCMGHTIEPVFPALTALVLDHPGVKSLKGVRVRGKLSISDGFGTFASEKGELLFTTYGVSGIPAMQLSGLLHGRRGITAHIDFFPEMSSDELTGILSNRSQSISTYKTENYFVGLLHRLVGAAIMRDVPICGTSFVSDIDNDKIQRIAVVLKDWKLPVIGAKGFAQAQVMGGGIDLSEFDPYTLESSKVPGLYAAGEVLDVYGDCGGYNLQWAWSSGMAAGVAAMEALNSNKIPTEGKASAICAKASNW